MHGFRLEIVLEGVTGIVRADGNPLDLYHHLTLGNFGTRQWLLDSRVPLQVTQNYKLFTAHY